MSAKPFIHDDFLLDTKWARELYHNYAEKLPIIDYHCHLPPELIAVDGNFRNIADAWLSGDHYKWRVMRANGVEERYCTGNASDLEKFLKWAETMPYLLRNPLYTWAHMELVRYFGVKDILGPETARKIWEVCNEKLARKDFTRRSFMVKSNVKVVCTTDDPADTLEHHKMIAADKNFPVKVSPTWRPDKGMAVENAELFKAWLARLEEVVDNDISSLSDFLAALRERHEFFGKMGCRISDHGLETIYAEDCTEKQAAIIFRKARSGRRIDSDEVLKFKSFMLHEFAVMDYEAGWVQQFHLGALRNVNSRMYKLLGPDKGYDTIGDWKVASALAKFLDRLESEGKLAKTILYNLNPADNAVLASMTGNFQDGSCAGKMQYGSAWWFLDHEDGIRRQIEDLSNLGLLGRFVGMLTDSRSFLSYPRHEYFRRILCNVLGWDMERGRLPSDIELVGKVVADVSYNNAAAYFNF